MPETLFTLDCRRMLSASGAGVINQFGIYTDQDKESHKHADTNLEDPYVHVELSLIDLSARLIELAVDQRDSGTDRWPETEIILERTFAIRNLDEKPGDIGYGITIRSSEPAKARRRATRKASEQRQPMQ